MLGRVLVASFCNLQSDMALAHAATREQPQPALSIPTKRENYWCSLQVDLTAVNAKYLYRIVHTYEHLMVACLYSMPPYVEQGDEDVCMRKRHAPHPNSHEGT
jgi:hypothetical protein